MSRSLPVVSRALEESMRLRGVAQRDLAIDADAQRAAADRLEQLARTPLELRARRDVVRRGSDA